MNDVMAWWGIKMPGILSKKRNSNNNNKLTIKVQLIFNFYSFSTYYMSFELCFYYYYILCLRHAVIWWYSTLDLVKINLIFSLFGTSRVSCLLFNLCLYFTNCMTMDINFRWNVWQQTYSVVDLKWQQTYKIIVLLICLLS